MTEGNPKDDARTGEPRRDEDKTSFEEFNDLMTKLLAVPKKELDEKRTEVKREKEKRSLRRS
jgi:hypothetical protein